MDREFSDIMNNLLGDVLDNEEPDCIYEGLRQFPRDIRPEENLARRVYNPNDPSMKNIDLEIEIKNLPPRTRMLFNAEIEIARSNYSRRFEDASEPDIPFANLGNIKFFEFADLNESLTSRAYYLNQQALRTSSLRASVFKLEFVDQSNECAETKSEKGAGVIQSKAIKIPEFSNEFRNQNFRLLNYVLSLLKADFFPMKLIEQIELFQKIRQDFEESFETIRNDKRAQFLDLGADLEDLFKQPSIKYRFGQSFKSIFQGYDLEHVLKVVYLMACLKRGFVRYYFDPSDSSFTLSLKRNTNFFNQQDVLITLIRFLELNFGFRLNQIVKTFFESKTPFTEFQTTEVDTEKGLTSEFKIGKETLQNIAAEELTIALKSGYLDSLLSLEVLEETIFFWVFANLLTSEYCPYVYCLKHFSESLMDLQAAFLNLKFVKASTESMRSGWDLKSSDILGSNDQSCVIISQFQLLTEKKKYFEYKYDFMSLLMKYDFCSVPIKKKEDIFPILSRLEEKDLKKQIIPDYDGFKLRHPDLYRYFKELLKHYLRMMLPWDQAKVLFEFLNKRQNIMALKSLDNSRLIEKFRMLDGKFAAHLAQIGRGDSLYFLYEKQMKDDISLTSEVEGFLGENLFPFDDVIINRIELLRDHLMFSESVRKTFIKKVEEEAKVLDNTVCFSNIKKCWSNIKNQVNDLLKDHDKNGCNADVPENKRFMVKDGKNLILEEKLKNEAKNFRRVKPELIFKIKDNKWDYIGPLISQMHWKVQNGLYAWYCIFVAHFNYNRRVIELLDDLGIRKVKSRVTAIKFFGIISKFFKFLDDAKSLEGFEQEFSKEPYYCIPFEIMMDIDNAFGYSEMTKQENALWDKEFFEHLHEWMTRNTAEVLYEIDVTKDYELFMDHLFTDFNKTISSRSNFKDIEKLIYVEPGYFNERESIMYGLFNHLNTESKSYFYRRNEENHQGFFKYKTFSEFTSNFFNFSAEGSAQSFKVSLRESDELIEQRNENADLYSTIKNKLKRNQNEVEEDKTKTVSKTICFGITGEALPKIMYWIYGPRYKPSLNLHIKKEAKKLRHVINADLISFVKQTYIHDWLINSLSSVNKSKINSLLDNRERLICFYKLMSTGSQEKWCVPMDMKDFHQHFGKTHYKAFCSILTQKMRKSIMCDFIREDFEHILKTLAPELSTGNLSFFLTSEEENLFYVHAQNKTGCRVKHKPKKEREGEPKEYMYDVSFEVQNGLMSGWKLTSLFGSLFNLTLNHMSEFYNTSFSHDVLFDVNVLGDDTHFKRRFLTSSLNHISFVNMINKIAHPDKQIISTVSSEFLKKKINTITQKIHYSNVRTLTTLLFQKDNVKRLLNDKNFIKDNIDLWNLFLVRIENKEIVRTVLKNKYFHQFFENLMNFKRNERMTDIEKLINTPTFYAGFLPGPLRSKIHDFNRSQESDIAKEITNYSLFKSLRVFVLDIEPGGFNGIRENVKRIVGAWKDKVASQDKLIELQRQLINAEADEIIASTGEYFDIGITADPNQTNAEERKAYLIFEPISETEEAVVFGEQNQYFDIKGFVDFGFRLMKQAIINNKKFSGLIGELIYHNENVSNVMYTAFKNFDEFSANFRALVNIFKNLKRQTDLENPLINKYSEKFGVDSFFRLAFSNKHAISVSRNYIHDEIIGFLNSYLSKFVIFYIIETAEIDPAEVERFLTRINISLDYYLHQNSDYVTSELESIVRLKLKDFEE